jgi:hypothetical protein
MKATQYFGRAVLRRRPNSGKGGMALLARFVGGDIAPPYQPPFRVFRSFIFVLFAVFAATPAFSQIQQSWVRTYNNGIPSANHQALKMALDTNGNIYITGFSQNTNGNLGYATIKYAPNGNQLWAARYDSTNYLTAQPTGIALDRQSNTIVIGNAVTVKYDAQGNTSWILPYNGAGVAADSSNAVYITGINGNYTTMKFDPSGSNLWSRTFTSAGPCGAQTINVSASNNIYVCGYEFVQYVPSRFDQTTTIKYTQAGTQLWKASAGTGGGLGSRGNILVEDAKVDSSENFYYVYNFENGSDTYITTAFSGDGAEMWAQYNPTGGNNSIVLALAIGALSNVIVTGANEHYPEPNGAYGTYMIGNGGAYVWASLYSLTAAGGSAGTAIASDQAGNAYVTGYSPATNSSNNIVTIKYDGNGNQIWLESYIGPNNSSAVANAIALDANGNVYVAGYETVAGGGTEMILIKYSPVPTIQKQSDGTIQLHATGNPGQTFDFQASTNFLSWLDLGTTNADTNGSVLFTDTNASNFAYRFYLTTPE